MGAWVDAPRTDRCSNRCGLQIFFIPLSGENPETKANAIAFPRGVPSSPLFKRDAKYITFQKISKPFIPKE
ncbi:hypothetical protein BK147_23665 [Paenibacillus sp. FSL R7-0337]|nr:hypothetical protein BK147_23665 [Paenibacillus sp. FSL R7-0337]